MKEWCVQFRQLFNGHASQCKVYVGGETVDDALDEFHSIGYVNVTVNGIWRCRRERGESCHEE